MLFEVLGLAHLFELASTGAPVFVEPMISGLWLAVHGPFDVAIEGRLVPAGPSAPPYMCAGLLDFIVELVIDCDV